MGYWSNGSGSFEGGGNSHGVIGLPPKTPLPTLLLLDSWEILPLSRAALFRVAPVQETVTRMKLVMDDTNPTNISNECIVFPNPMLKPNCIYGCRKSIRPKPTLRQLIDLVKHSLKGSLPHK